MMLAKRGKLQHVTEDVTNTTSSRRIAHHTAEPSIKRMKWSSSIRVAPSTKRPRLPEVVSVESSRKNVRVDTPINEARSPSHYLGCLRVQGQGGRDGDRTRLPHPDCPLRVLKTAQ